MLQVERFFRQSRNELNIFNFTKHSFDIDSVEQVFRKIEHVQFVSTLWKGWTFTINSIHTRKWLTITTRCAIWLLLLLCLLCIYLWRGILTAKITYLNYLLLISHLWNYMQIWPRVQCASPIGSSVVRHVAAYCGVLRCERSFTYLLRPTPLLLLLTAEMT